MRSKAQTIPPPLPLEGSRTTQRMIPEILDAMRKACTRTDQPNVVRRVTEDDEVRTDDPGCPLPTEPRR